MLRDYCFQIKIKKLHPANTLPFLFAGLKSNCCLDGAEDDEHIGTFNHNSFIFISTPHFVTSLLCTVSYEFIQTY